MWVHNFTFSLNWSFIDAKKTLHSKGSRTFSSAKGNLAGWITSAGSWDWIQQQIFRLQENNKWCSRKTGSQHHRKTNSTRATFWCTCCILLFIYFLVHLSPTWSCEASDRFLKNCAVNSWTCKPVTRRIEGRSLTKLKLYKKSLPDCLSLTHVQKLLRDLLKPPIGFKIHSSKMMRMGFVMLRTTSSLHHHMHRRRKYLAIKDTARKRWETKVELIPV